MNAKQARCIRSGLPSRGYHLNNFPSLVHSELGASAANSPLSAGALQSGTGALTGHLALEFGEAADHLDASKNLADLSLI